MRPINKDAVTMKPINLKPAVESITQDKVSLNNIMNNLPGKDEKVFLSTPEGSHKSVTTALQQPHSDEKPTSLENIIENTSIKSCLNKDPITENLHLAMPGLVSSGTIAPALISFRDFLREDDPDKIKRLMQSSSSFYDFEVDYAKKLAHKNLTKGAKESGYSFLLLEKGANLVGFSCFGLIPCTLDRYNLHCLAVDDKFIGKDYDKKIIEKTEDSAKEMGGKRLYIETPSSDHYYHARQFYINCNYIDGGRLKDFYKDGESKIIYFKNLV
jgi:ribosomal protein S18 acetylase RimI-like enzyme